MYETEEKPYKGNPVIEILDDGEPFGADLPTKEHFDVGVTKADALLDVEEDLQRFVERHSG